jgi:phosphoglycolate phosphatase-like HAD superfamily hydrolase
MSKEISTINDLLDNYKVIYWDFDGVILNSMEIRTLGFEKVLHKYPEHQIEALVTYHLQNGGLSRYNKFRYFFNDIRKEDVSDAVIKSLAQDFSEIMLNILTDKKLLIQDSLSFIKANFNNFKFHIVSGSDGVELNKLCHALDIASYFLTIEGSPTPKIELVEKSLTLNNYNTGDCILIGDAFNDYDAAIKNDITFCGYNNADLMNQSQYYIHEFSKIKK